MGWVVPAIGGAGTLGGAALGGKAAKDAAKIQAQTADKALAFEREREAGRKAEYDKAMARYEQQWNAWNNTRNALLGRYGISVSAPTSPGMPVRGASTPIPSSPVYATGSPGTQALQMPAQAQSIRAMIGPQDLGAWNNWERQGLA